MRFSVTGLFFLFACSPQSSQDSPVTGNANTTVSASPDPSASETQSPEPNSNVGSSPTPSPDDNPSPAASLVRPLPEQKLTAVDSAPPIPAGVGIVYVGLGELQIHERKIVTLDGGRFSSSELQKHLVPALFDALSKEAGNAAPDARPQPLLLAVDERVPFATLVNIMYTAGRAQFASYALVVETAPRSYAALPLEPPKLAMGGAAPPPTPVSVNVGMDGYRYHAPPPPDAIDVDIPPKPGLIPAKSPSAPVTQLDRWDVETLAAKAKATKSAQPSYAGARITAEPDVPLGALLQATAALRGSECTEAQASTCVFSHIVVTAGAPKPASPVKFKGVYGG